MKSAWIPLTFDDEEHKNIFISILKDKDEDTFKTDFSDFEDLELIDSSFWDGSDGLGYFTDGNKTYENIK